uniref:Putative DNA binding, helix-turn-helix domain containing protein n=1 Tax=viral metagenome TaxID=1070528 RepID=A0A6H1ZJD0_9ZZZZ
MAAKKKIAKVKPKKKHPGGRPTKFNKEIKAKAEKLSRRGFTDQEIADILDVNKTTIVRWKLKHAEFCTSMGLWKEQADDKVEKSLFERACGYSHPDTKAQWVETTELIDGELVKCGKWVYADMIKHYPPDTPAASLWLRNRRPKDWRDKIDHELGGKDGGPIEIQSSPEEKKMLQAIAKELFKKADG